MGAARRWAATAFALVATIVVLTGTVAEAMPIEAVRRVEGRLALVAADRGPTDPAPTEARAGQAGQPPAEPEGHADEPVQALLETDDGVIRLDPGSVPPSARTGAATTALVGDDGVGIVQAVGPTAPTAPLVTGTRKVLVVDVTWPNAAAPVDPAPAAAMTAANNWLVSASGNQLNLTWKVGPTITLGSAPDYCNTTFAALAGVDNSVNAQLAPDNVNQYHHVIYRMPKINNCWLGIAYIGGSKVMINGGMSLLVTVHELGHNFGLEHANFLYCENATHTAYSSLEPHGLNRCESDEYGDLYSAMGQFTTGSYTGSQLQELGWLSSGNQVDLSGTDASTCLFPLTATTSGAKIGSFDVPSVGKIYLENRQAQGVDSVLAGSPSLGIQARVVRRAEPDPGPDWGPQPHLLVNRPERFSFLGGYYYDQISSIPPNDPWLPLGGQLQVSTAAAQPSGCIPVTVHNGLAPKPPSAPTAVTASAAHQSAIVSWGPPDVPGSSAVSSYAVTASPGGATCTTATTSCTVSGLSNSTSYTFTVRATNAAGQGPASSPSNAVTPPGTYTAVTPARLLDTRPGQSTVDGVSAGGGALGVSATRNVPVLGRGGVPAIGVGAVVVNVTVTGPSFGGYVTAWPNGSARPTASTINFTAGQTIANLAIVKVGPNGTIDLFNAFGATHVIVDVQGWFPTNVGITSLTPARLLDTRGGPTVDGQASGGGAIGESQVRALTVLGRGGVPATGVAAVALNVTVTDPTWYSYVTAFPHGSPRPTASNVNFDPGQTIAIQVIAKVGTNGQVDLFNLFGNVHVVADVQGWFPTGSQMTSLTPARLLDTRPGYPTIDGAGSGLGSLGPSGTVNLPVLGRGGVPASGVGAVALNVTVTEPTRPSFLTAHPGSTSTPLASNINFGPNQTISNLVIVKVGPSGTVNLSNQLGSTHVIADVQAWFPT